VILCSLQVQVAAIPGPGLKFLPNFKFLIMIVDSYSDLNNNNNTSTMTVMQLSLSDLASAAEKLYFIVFRQQLELDC
jgi:hypothetical protein